MAATSDLPEVVVLILNWNGRAFLPDCLAALANQDYACYAVTLVDNGSTDDSVAWVRANHPAVEVITAGTNLGFSAGNNLALRSDPADIFVLVNPDVNTSPNWLTSLVRVFDQDPRIGIAGSKLWYPDGRTIQHAGGFLRPPQAMPGHYHIGAVDEGQAEEMRDVDYVIGGATAIRREVFDSIGLLDEGFFLYYEDVDLCARARRAGWRVVYAPTATAVHIESALAVKGSNSYLQRFHTGRWRFILKHYDGAEIVAATLPVELEWLAKLDPAERLAAGLAYQQAIADWHDCLVAREREGAGSLTAATATTIRDGLIMLRDTAWAPPVPTRDLHQLAETATIAEPTFRSSVPLVAALRTAWNNVATRWYLQPIRAQQSALNQALSSALRSRSEKLAWQATRLHELQSTQASLQNETRDLARQIRETRQRIASLEQRVAELGATLPSND